MSKCLGGRRASARHGKETFRIFDAVDLYPHLQNLTAMKPVVVNPAISLEQLFQEFASIEDEKNREVVGNRFSSRCAAAPQTPACRSRARYHAETGEMPGRNAKRIAEQPVA